MIRTSAGLTLVALLAGCGGEPAEEAVPADPGTVVVEPATPAPAVSPGAPEAIAEVRDPEGRTLGTVRLTQTAEGVALAGSLSGIPAGVHAFHIHTTGSCEPSFEAAGGHFNPTGREHGTLNPNGPHLGDLPNVQVTPDSTVQIQAMAQNVTLADGPNALLDADGAAIMMHAEPDDYRTEPSGDAGDRIACGVVNPAAS